MCGAGLFRDYPAPTRFNGIARPNCRLKAVHLIRKLPVELASVAALPFIASVTKDSAEEQSGSPAQPSALVERSAIRLKQTPESTSAKSSVDLFWSHLLLHSCYVAK
jgi:hypothetical protein